MKGNWKKEEGKAYNYDVYCVSFSALALPLSPLPPTPSNKINEKKGVLQKGMLLNKRGCSYAACLMLALWSKLHREFCHFVVETRVLFLCFNVSL